MYLSWILCLQQVSDFLFMYIYASCPRLLKILYPSLKNSISGGTIVAAINLVKERGVDHKQIKVVSRKDWKLIQFQECAKS